MVSSAVLVGALFAYMVQQAVTAPEGGEPVADVVSVQNGERGDRLVEVRVTNHADRGIRELTAEVACDDPAPSVVLTNLPAEGDRRAIVVCPAGTPTEATVSSYVWT